MPSGLLFFKFNYIFNFAMKYSAKVVYLCGAYSVAFAHTVNSTAAYIVFVYKRIRRFAFLFNRFPERRITNHIKIINYSQNLDNGLNYDYNMCK